MQNFLQSAFLQALGYAIANSLWQVALLWLGVMLINSISKFSSSRKYWVGIIAEFAAFTWFLSTLEFYYVHCKEALQQVSDSQNGSSATYIYEPVINSFSSAILYITVKGEQLLPYLSFAYLLILFFLVVRMARAFSFTKKIRSQGLQKAGVNWRIFVKTTAAHLGINREVKLYFSELIKSPLTIGFIKPMILVPVASINYLTTDQLEAILLHELAHIKRADYIINILQSVIEIILFFNPFVQLMGKMIKHERENSCDDWVLQFQYKPAMYAEALLKVATVSATPAFALNATGNKSDLLSRVKRMLNKQEKSHHYRNQVFALLLLTIMLVTTAWLQPEIKYNNIKPGNTTTNHQLVVEPLTASIDNPLFNPAYFFSKPIQKEVDKAMILANTSIAESKLSKENIKDLLTKVTPIALEKLENFSNSFQPELSDATSDAKLALKDIAVDLSKETRNIIADSLINAIAIAKDVLSNQLNNINWEDINSKVKDAGAAAVISTGMDKQMEAVYTQQAASALKKVKQEIVQQFKQTTSINFENLISQLDIEKNAEDAKTFQKDVKDKQKRELRLQINKQSKTSVQPAIGTNHDEEYKEEDASFNHHFLPQYSDMVVAPQFYSPATYMSAPNYNVHFTDSIAGIKEAIIVVKHNPANDSNHIKQITVEITGNNGVKKTYEFSVEVYQ